jgi:hypothetical protein
MAAYLVLALGACVVSIMAGLSGVWATPISRRAESKASGDEPPAMPQLPPEVIDVLRRNALLDGATVPSTMAPEGPAQPTVSLPSS